MKQFGYMDAGQPVRYVFNSHVFLLLAETDASVFIRGEPIDRLAVHDHESNGSYGPDSTLRSR